MGSVLSRQLAAQLPLIQSFDAPVLHRRKAWGESATGSAEGCRACGRRTLPLPGVLLAEDAGDASDAIEEPSCDVAEPGEPIGDDACAQQRPAHKSEGRVSLSRARWPASSGARTALPAALLSPVTTASSCFPAGLLFGDSGDSAVGDSSPDSAALNVGELAPSAVASSSTTAGGPAAAALPSSSSRAPSPSSTMSSSCRPSSSDSEMSGLLRDR